MHFEPFLNGENCSTFREARFQKRVGFGTNGSTNNDGLPLSHFVVPNRYLLLLARCCVTGNFWFAGVPSESSELLSRHQIFIEVLELTGAFHPDITRPERVLELR